MAKILLVEDDRILRTLVKEYLLDGSYAVDTAEDIDAAQHQLRMNEYDLLILDWMLPGGSGVDICRDFRSNGGQAPVLFLTSRKDRKDKVTGLDAGADDYLVKPFDKMEFQARVRALLRRKRSSLTNIIQLGSLELDRTTRTVRQSGQEVKLRPREYSLLEFFALHPNQSFTSEALVRRVWSSDTETSADTVRMHVMALRKKLQNGENNLPISYTRGHGYRLTT